LGHSCGEGGKEKPRANSGGSILKILALQSVNQRLGKMGMDGENCPFPTGKDKKKMG